MYVIDPNIVVGPHCKMALMKGQIIQNLDLRENMYSIKSGRLRTWVKGGSGSNSSKLMHGKNAIWPTFV
jgi:hypothetical protein